MTDDLRHKLFELTLEKKEITYYDIRQKVLGLTDEDEIFFKSCTYFDKVKSSKKSKSKKSEDELQIEVEQETTQKDNAGKSKKDQKRWIRIPTKKAENRKFFALKGYHLLKSVLPKEKLDLLFCEIDRCYIADKLVEIMHYSCNDEKLKQNLANAGFSEYFEYINMLIFLGLQI